MKILQINAVNGIGSTGRTTKEIADYCNENGHIGLIAYSDGNDYINGYHIGCRLEKKAHGLLSRVFGLQGYFSKNGTKKLIKYIKQEKPDVIRIGNLHANFINIPMLLKFIGENDIATIITLDDCFWFTGKCTHYTLDKCNKWERECGKCPRIYKDNISWFLDNTKKMLKDKRKLYNNIPRLGVVGVSKWITNESKKSILSNAKYINTIYNWIDTDKFKPVDACELKSKLKLEDKFVILGIATKWSNAKGLDKFIDISKKITNDEKIILVGKIDRDIKLPSNIIHINHTNNIDELVKYYSMADVFLQLSKEETFGKVVAESLSCGTPAIVLDSTANSELIGYKCGYVVDKDSIGEVIGSIKKIKNNKKIHYSTSCREFAIKTFNKNDRILEYMDLCKKLIDLKAD